MHIIILRKPLEYIILFFVFLLFLVPSVVVAKDNYNVTETSSHIQEMILPLIDTSQENAKYQPMDLQIYFNNPCWAINETIHSIRIVYEDGTDFYEIESQIYNLTYKDENHIESCRIVFLIPYAANGKEKYYVLYDESTVIPKKYPDHLTIENTRYYYEPIPGQKADINYYKISEDGYAVFGVSYKGTLFGNGLSQVVTKFKPMTKDVEMSSFDQIASFAMIYSTDNSDIDYTGTSWDNEASTSILVDGNLMVKTRIETLSPEDTLKTNNVYTYYYCPTDTKRISINVNHEVMETCKIAGSTISDGIIASLMTFKSRSAAIKNLNIGNILPWIHVYTEDNIIKEYQISSDPTSKESEEMVLTTLDDVDLGNRPWVCIDDPSTGKAFGLVFESNINVSNRDEEDGLQVTSFVQQTLKLPGLEVDTGNIYVTRNYYDKGDERDLTLRKGLNINLKAEYVTIDNGGYQAIDGEADIFQKLAPMRTDYKGQSSEDAYTEESYNLETFVHLAPSIPFGSSFSLLSGKNISYINAEIYKQNSLMSSGSAYRLPFYDVNFDLKEKTLFQKIKMIFGLFDWKNSSIYKKIIFSDLKPGRYIVKIYKENPLFEKERKYIGFEIVDLKKSDVVHIYCRPQGAIKLSVNNQDKNGVENVEFHLEIEDEVISQNISDKEGISIVYAPCFPLKPYNLKVFYKGFLIEEKKITLGFKHYFKPLKENFELELFDLKVKIKDNWGYAPQIEINPRLTSNGMKESVFISGKKTYEGEYVFSNLVKEKYTLSMNYKSFDLKKEISLNADQSIDIVFPAVYKVSFNIMNSFGETINEGKISVSRENKTQKISIREGKSFIFVPPGNYQIRVSSGDIEIAKQKIIIKGEKGIDLVTSQDSLLHSILFYIGIALAMFSVMLMFWKKKIQLGARLLVIALIIIALISPWWVLSGKSEDIETSTKAFLYPPKIVTLTSAYDGVSGEVSKAPEEVTMVLFLISIFLIASIFMIFASIFIKDKYYKTTVLTSVFSAILLIIVLSVFFFAMSMITEISVGSLIGSGDIEVTIPEAINKETIFSVWAPGIGFYLTIIATLLLTFVLFNKKMEKLLNKNLKMRKS